MEVTFTKKIYMKAFNKALTFLATFVFLVIVMSLLCSVPIWLLWNWLMPTLFGLPEIGWLQALGLWVLCSLLFKSMSETK